MRRVKEFIEIGGTQFEVFHAPKKDRLHVVGYKPLHKCYQRPSISKYRIFDGWERWLYYNQDTRDILTWVHDSGIISYNTMMFTWGCHADIEYNGGLEECSIYVTKTRQEITIYDL